MTKTCVSCSESEPAAKFSRHHRTCNRCRNASSRDYQRKRSANRTDEERETHRLRTRKYREEQPHIPFYMTSRYLANKAGVFSDLTKEDAQDIYETPNICAYCTKEIDVTVKRSSHIDHIIPMVQGGPNSRWNLVRACISCNTSKCSSSLVDFRNRTPEFTEERYSAVVSGMVALSGRSLTQINELLTQSHAFEVAAQRERAHMESLLRGFNVENTVNYAS